MLRVLPSVLLAGTGQADIDFQLPGGPVNGSIGLAIFDAAGRLVSAQSMPVPNTGRGSFAWDGRDAGGSLQPSGMYQIRAQAGALGGESRLLILR